MPASGLSDDQVASELTKMVEFIKKEAEEKAKEIRIKANEEYEIEKAEIVRSEIANIDKEFEVKNKQAAMSQQIVKSTAANKTRLEVLGAKSEILDTVFEEAEKSLKEVSKDAKKYEDLLTKLIVQSAKLLKDEDVVIASVRESDKEVAAKAAKAASEQIEGDIEIKIDENNYINPESAGGVVLSTESGKISIDNTLEERLHLLGSKSLPLVRLELFGFSRTRKYFD